MKLVEDIDQTIEELQRLEALQNGQDFDPVSRRSSVDPFAFLPENQAKAMKRMDDNDAATLAAHGHSRVSTRHLTLLDAWAHLMDTAAKTDRPVPPEKRVTPKFFSLGLGNFSAICIRDRRNGYGIGFDEEFFQSLFIVTNIVGSELKDWALGGHIGGDTNLLVDYPPTSQKTIEAVGITLDAIVRHGDMTHGARMQDFLANKFSFDLSPFCVLLWLRVCFFIVAHEYSHYLYDHHKDGRPSCRQALADRLRVLAPGTYPDLPPLSDEQLKNFLGPQSDEFHCDHQAISFMRASWTYDSQTKEGRRNFLLDTLAFSVFFAFADSIERLAVLRIRGRDPANHAFFRQHAHVFDLYFRESHPSPFDRWRGLLDSTADEVLRCTPQQAEIFTFPVWSAFHFPIRLEAMDRKVFSKAQSPELVAPKWRSRTGLKHLIENLWPEDDFKSLAEHRGLDPPDVSLSRFWNNQP